VQKEAINMVTRERYEVIKKFGNALFKFHQKQASPDNKEKLRNMLKKMVLTNEFQWTTNQQTKEVIVTFELGQMVVTVGEQLFTVKIDEVTRENLKKYGEGTKVKSKQPYPKFTNSIKFPVPSTGEKEIHISSNMNNIEKGFRPLAQTSQKDKYALAQDEVFQRHKEKELAAVSRPLVKEVTKEEEVRTGEPLFLGFLTEGDYAM